MRLEEEQSEDDRSGISDVTSKQLAVKWLFVLHHTDAAFWRWEQTVTSSDGESE